MIMSEYEERFRPSAPSLHQTFAATRGRNRGRRRHRRIWVAAAAVGVLMVTYKVASPHPVHRWTSSQSRTTAAQVKGFGCRPVVTYPRALRAGVRKPPRKEPAGAAWAVVVYGDFTGSGLGRERAGRVVGVGSTIAVASSS
jgi:hypothetical protein